MAYNGLYKRSSGIKYSNVSYYNYIE